MSIMTIAAAASTIALYPVAETDPVLSEPETFVSPTAAEALSEGRDTVFCLDVPEGAASHEHICLTSNEWQVVLEQAAENDAFERSVDVRHRQILRASPSNQSAMTP